jgi:hypothetical protein
MARKSLEKLKNTKKNSQTQKLETPPEINSPNTLNASSPPKIDIIMFLLSTTLLAKNQLCAHTLPP